MRKALAASGLGFTLVVFLFIAMAVPEIRGVSEALLTPGYYLPVAYWGAVHDPLQLLSAFTLNVVFYAMVSAILLFVWQRLKQRR